MKLAKQDRTAEISNPMQIRAFIANGWIEISESAPIEEPLKEEQIIEEPSKPKPRGRKPQTKKVADE